MMYSCALWSEAEGGARGDLETGPIPGDLEAAQLRKIHHVLRAARVKPGHRILEFGSGWGGLAIEVNLLSMISVNMDLHIFTGGTSLWLRGGYLDTINGTEKARRRAYPRGGPGKPHPCPSARLS
jgi:hypothetical protein